MSPSDFPTDSCPDCLDLVGPTEPSSRDHSHDRQVKTGDPRNRQKADCLVRKPAVVEDTAEGPLLRRPDEDRRRDREDCRGDDCDGERERASEKSAAANNRRPHSGRKEPGKVSSGSALHLKMRLGPQNCRHIQRISRGTPQIFKMWPIGGGRALMFVGLVRPTP